MKKINFKFILLSIILCLIPMIFGIAMYKELPDKIAIHFDINNNPNNYVSKEVAVFGLPIFMSIFQLVFCIINDLSSREKSKLENIVKWVLPITTIILYFVTIIFSLGVSVDIRKVVCLLIGGIIIVIGNYLPKLNSSNYINIHPKSLASDEKRWRKFSRILGYCYVISGLLISLSILLSPIYSAITVLLFIIANIVISIYSIFPVKS